MVCHLLPFAKVGQQISYFFFFSTHFKSVSLMGIYFINGAIYLVAYSSENLEWL